MMFYQILNHLFQTFLDMSDIQNPKMGFYDISISSYQDHLLPNYATLIIRKPSVSEFTKVPAPHSWPYFGSHIEDAKEILK